MKARVDDLLAPSFSMAVPVGWACPESRCNSLSVAIRSSDSYDSQIREMESTGAYRVYRAIVWF